MSQHLMAHIKTRKTDWLDIEKAEGVPPTQCMVWMNPDTQQIYRIVISHSISSSRRFLADVFWKALSSTSCTLPALVHSLQLFHVL